MLLQAAINGARSRSEHGALPLTPAEQATASASAAGAGAGAIHVHVRNPDGAESLDPADLALLLGALRVVVRLPIGVSTGAWIIPDPAARHRAVQRWRDRPDFASVNFHEVGSAALATCLLEQGVAVEAGLVDAAAATALVESGLGARCLRILLEPQERDLRAALRTVAEIEAVLDRGRVTTARLLHGSEVTVWPLLDEALRRGYDVRIGLEDTLLLPDGAPAPDNTALVRAARVRVLAEH